MKIYIAGKITGEPDYWVKFASAACKIKFEGHIPLNPAELPEGLDPADYMRICFAMLDCADGAVFLKGWENSKGASMEHAYCLYTGKPVIYEEE